MKPNCGNCEYLGAVLVGESLEHPHFKICRRNPPLVVSPTSISGIWPRVEEDDWCGEFNPKSQADRPIRQQSRQSMPPHIFVGKAMVDGMTRWTTPW